MSEFYNRHYITVDAQGRIAAGWSDGPHPERNATTAICINKQGGYQFRFADSGKVNPPLYTMDGLPLYKYADGKIIPRTDEEIATDRAAIPAAPPSAQDQLRTDIDFLAAMQGVSL